jgi:hypothetical protein
MAESENYKNQNNMLIFVESFNERSTKFPPNKGTKGGVSPNKGGKGVSTYNFARTLNTPLNLPFLGETFKTKNNRIQKSTLPWQS